MSKEKKYYISKSGHTLKRKNPIVTKDGTIYETDLSTTLKSHEYVDGKLITRTEGGFVFVTNIESDTPRSFNKSTETKQFKLSELIGVDKEINEEMVLSEAELLKNVKLSPSYDKLSDYCYYGSANAMLKAEIDDIINKYPFSSSVENEEKEQDSEEEKNEKKEKEQDSEEEKTKKKEKEQDSEEEKNEKKEKDKEEFFNNLSDFQKILLNRNTTPLYKATFKVPIETDEGIKYVYKSFIHPSNEDGDLDVESTNYNIYLSSLIDITNLIDELYCDNLYRVMTHDTIKNFDFTYSKDDVEEYIIGGSKVNKVLRIYGRAFDDIKKYIDGIGTVNTITYNGKNNIPKEYFYDNLNLKGWVPYNIAEHFKSDIKTSVESGNLNVGMGIEDVSYELLRRFIINSPNIFRAKGTKKAINKVFSLFGIKEEWYDIFEIYQPVSGYIGNDKLEEIAEQNYNVNNMEQSISDVDPHTFDIERDMFKGINIKAKYKCPVPECGCDEYYKTFELEDGEYVYYATCIENGHKYKFNDNLVGIPYHSESTYENYFQQKGGWYRETGGFHEHIDGESQVIDIPYGNNPHIGNGNYDNGYDYVMSYANLFKRYETPGGEDEEDVLGFEITQKRQLVSDKIFTVLSKNRATVYLYKRHNEDKQGVISMPTATMTYNFTSKNLTGITNDWHEKIPYGSDQLYVIGATVSSRTDTDKIYANEWSGAVELATDGFNSASITLYQRKATTPNVPINDCVYTFSSGNLTNFAQQNWSRTIPTPEANTKLWVTTATAISTEPTDVIASSEWADPTVMVKDGQGVLKSTAFIRSTEEPKTPTGGSYINPNPEFNSEIGGEWSDGIPSGDKGLWASTRIFTTDGLEPQQEAWTKPEVMVDSAVFDVKFSSEEEPGIPGGPPNEGDMKNPNWSNTADETTIWMATSNFKNEMWGEWSISRIKGEKGDDNTELNINLKNMLIVFDIDNIQGSYTRATKSDFELIKKLTLPYIEQIIPSTTIFDMILKSSEPIWSYLDSYCEMDENGSATGMKIVRYQDVNPYSEHGKEGREDKNMIEIEELTSIVKKKFGGDFKHEDVIIVGETLTGDKYTNYDNIFIFKGESDDCPINVNPDWRIIDNLI